MVWDAPEDTGGLPPRYYRLRFGSKGQASLTNILTRVLEPTFFLSNLQPLTAYDVSVAAVTTVATGEFSPRFTAVTSDKSSPSPPTITDFVLTTAYGGQVSWDSSSDGGSGLTSFTVAVYVAVGAGRVRV